MHRMLLLLLDIGWNAKRNKFLKAIVVTKSQAWTRDNDFNDTSLYIIFILFR